MSEPPQTYGLTARFYRALNAGRTYGGIPAQLALVLWGLLSLPLFSFPIPWLWKAVVFALGVAIHATLAYIGRDNPYWYRQLKRKWAHPDRATAHYPQGRRPR